jgi:hypothetical protein
MDQIPLEEALASVDFPVYGLVEEVCGLRYNGCGAFPGDYQPFTLNYQSERYEPLRVRGMTLNTFYVTSFRDLRRIIPQMHDISLGFIVHRLDGVEIRAPFRWEGMLTIDRKAFFGSICHYPAPLRVSACCFSGDSTHFDGQAFGPNVEELIQILESLHVINGEDMKSGIKEHNHDPDPGKPAHAQRQSGEESKRTEQ